MSHRASASTIGREFDPEAFDVKDADVAVRDFNSRQMEPM